MLQRHFETSTQRNKNEFLIVHYFNSFLWHNCYNLLIKHILWYYFYVLLTRFVPILDWLSFLEVFLPYFFSTLCHMLTQNLQKRFICTNQPFNLILYAYQVSYFQGIIVEECHILLIKCVNKVSLMFFLLCLLSFVFVISPNTLWKGRLWTYSSLSVSPPSTQHLPEANFYFLATSFHHPSLSFCHWIHTS